jgi:hypothetical protein
MQRWSIPNILAAIAVCLVALCVLVYVADWLVLQVHEHRGTAYGSVLVDNADVVREKGGKVEYFYNPPQSTPCVHSLFPHEGQSPCWWLARHSDVQQYLN